MRLPQRQRIRVFRRNRERIRDRAQVASEKSNTAPGACNGLPDVVNPLHRETALADQRAHLGRLADKAACLNEIR